MRLLHNVVRFYPYIGGVEQTVHQLAKRQVRRGHHVDVVCADEPARSPSEVDGVHVHRLPYLGKLANTNLSFGIARTIGRLRPDLIHAHLPTVWWFDAAVRAAKRFGIPLVVTYNNDITGTGLKGLVAAVYNRVLMLRNLAATDCVVASTPAYLERSPWLSASRARKHVIPWGVDLERFAAAPPASTEVPTFAFLALLDEFHRYKGLGPTLDALAALARDGHEFRLRVGGRGALTEEYATQARDLGIAERVEFCGFVPDEELADFFAAADAFVLASTHWQQEGFGLVLLEALACARPVITTDIVGVAGDVRETGSGFVVAPGDRESLQQALREAISDRESLIEMGARGRALVERSYGWDTIVESHEDLYRCVLRSTGANPESA